MTSEEQGALNFSLYEALSKEQPIEKIKALIAKGADANATDGYSCTMLKVARTVEQTKLLIEAGADVNALAPNGETALLVSLSQSTEKARVLLEAGADVTIGTNSGTVLQYARGQEQKDLIRGALNKTLWRAVANGDVNMANRALVSGADISIRDKTNDRTLLHIAKGAEMVEFLVEQGELDVNARDNLGRTPLMRMALKGQKEEVSQLLKYKEVDVNATIGKQPDYSVYRKFEKILETHQYVNKPKGIDMKDIAVPSAWNLAFCSGHSEVADIIVKEMDKRESWAETKRVLDGMEILKSRKLRE
ncbi:MAG: ankyrin repeat domain-containing protein [Acetobacter sp.]|nr:ankyrin repeat domain-containing protein [Acetobacter sp.]